MLGAVLSGEAVTVRGVTLPAEWVRRSERVLRRRFDQVTRDPFCAPWLLRAMVHRATGELIGRIGFHGEPGVNAVGLTDAVELGYTVEPEFRRLGYAEEAILGMMGWARDRSISRFVVSVAPDNHASLRLAAKLGFSEIARVEDEDGDGPEIVLTLRAPMSFATAPRSG